MIYGELSNMFKAYSGAFVTPDLQPTVGDLFMFDDAAWYSIQQFKGEPISKASILELEAAPWAHQNLSHLFRRTPARHLMGLDPQLLDEAVDDFCLRAGHVRLYSQYRNHEMPLKFDTLLFQQFARHARNLTITVAYHGIRLQCAADYRATSLGYGQEPANDRLAVVDDLADIFRAGCRTVSLTLNLNFDIPCTQERRHAVNEAWVQDLVRKKLSGFGFDINLCIYNRCDERQHVLKNQFECPRWENIFSLHTSFSTTFDQWSSWSKRIMSPYEAAALECH